MNINILNDSLDNENIFEYEGNIYSTKKNNGCTGCAFCDVKNKSTCIFPKSIKISCAPVGRIDRQSIIWVKRN